MQDEEEDRFPAKRILDENSKRKLYKVDWDGVDPETGRAWSPTWEPFEYVSDALIKEWSTRKRRRSDVDYQRAARTALRDYDIRRSKSGTPSEEGYVSPAEQEPSRWAARDEYSPPSSSKQPKSKAKPKAQPKQKRVSQASGSGSSYKPSTQSMESTQISTELSTFISSNSLNALRSQQDKSRRHSEPSKTATKGKNVVNAGKRRRTDLEPASPPESPRSAKKQNRRRTVNHDNNDIDDVEARKKLVRNGKKRQETPSEDEIQEQEQDDDDDDDEGSTSDAPLVASSSNSSRRKLKSHHDHVSPVGLEERPPAPRKRLSEIPESLRLRTSTTSVSAVTHGSTNEMANNLFLETSIFDDLPPSARDASEAGKKADPEAVLKATRKAALARKRSSGRQITRTRSEEDASRSAEASLPSFKKATNGGTAETRKTFNLHQRRTSAPMPPEKGKQDWDLLKTAEVERARLAARALANDTSTAIVPDSQSQNDHTLSPVLSPPQRRRNGSSVELVEGLSVRQPWRPTYPPGSRLAHANIEKPRKPVRVPDPEVFKPLLTSTQMTDDIHQFSSQAPSPAGDNSSSQEVLQQLTTAPKPVTPDQQVQTNEDDAGDSSMILPSTTTGEDYQTAHDISQDMDYVDALPSPPANDHTVDPAFFEEIPADVTASAIETAEAITSAVDTGLAEVVASVTGLEDVLTTSAEQTRSKSNPPGPTGLRVLGVAEVVEVVTADRRAKAMIRDSTLVEHDSQKQEIQLFIEAPHYYLHQERALSKQATWDIELATSTDGDGETSWHLMLDMTAPGWTMEKRLRKYVSSAGDSGDAQVLSLYNDLLTAHTALKKLSDQQVMQIGQLETEVVNVREDDRKKARRIEELEREKIKLKDEVRILRTQVSLGVKQVELIWSAKEQRMREELDKAQKQLRMAKEMIRTSKLEELIGKAARVDELEGLEVIRKAEEYAQRQERKSRGVTKDNLYNSFVNSITEYARRSVSANPAPGPIQAATSVNNEASSEDEDFVGESSGSGGSGSSESEDSDDEGAPILAPQAIHPSAVPLDMSGIQYATVFNEVASMGGEGVLPGGLASISPAPNQLDTSMQVLEHYTHVAEDTSGETTEVTTSTSAMIMSSNNVANSSSLKGDSQQSVQPDSTGSHGHQIESEEILELDSAILETQFGYPCSWGQGAGSECRKLFASQKELYDHVIDEHAML